jgi:hypothetical protein
MPLADVRRFVRVREGKVGLGAAGWPRARGSSAGLYRIRSAIEAQLGKFHVENLS